MMWLAVLLIVGGLAWFAVGFVLVTNGTAVAPRRRTDEAHRHQEGRLAGGVARRIPPHTQ